MAEQDTTIDRDPDATLKPGTGTLPEAQVARVTAKVRRFGDYELQGEIARGGMGVVFRARQISLNRPVALKMILAGGLAGENEIKRFRSEALAAAALDHPNIVPVFDVGELEGQHYFAMGLVEGESLAAVLARGPMGGRQAATLVRTLALAIQYAHDRGIIHRDLKPANVLIDVHAGPRITDFGLAKRLSDKEGVTHTGDVMGTPSYMPPEQARGNTHAVTAAADIYALGAILYALIVGRPPFAAASPIDTVLQVIEQQAVPPRQLNPAIDPDLDLIVMKCLQKPPELRYPTAQALAEDLARYLASETISARRLQLRDLMAVLLRDTCHASVLENWGELWMRHGAFLFLLCLATNALQFFGVQSRLPYAALWFPLLAGWATAFWRMRQVLGPITFVERQMLHIWAGNVIGISLTFALELVLGLPVLALAPTIAVQSGSTFLAKAGILTGDFYAQAAALYACGIGMALAPRYSMLLFGAVSAACFIVPGMRYRKVSNPPGGPPR